MPEQETEIPDDSEAELEKTVNMVAYPDEDLSPSEESVRQWAAEVTEDDGILETRTVENTEFKLSVFTDKDEEAPRRSMTFNVMESEDLSHLEGEHADGAIVAEQITKTSQIRESSLTSLGNDVKRRLFKDLPGQLTGVLTKDHSGISIGFKWANPEEHQWEVKLQGGSFDTQRLLSKEEKREDDDLYETVSERPCYNITIKIVAPNEELLDSWTNDIIPEAHKLLSAMPGVGKVRYMDCTVTKEEQGECYNL